MLIEDSHAGDAGAAGEKNAIKEGVKEGVSEKLENRPKVTQKRTVPMTEANFVAEMHETGSFNTIWSPRRRPPLVFFEVPTTDGVPDIVVCDIDEEAAEARFQAGMTRPINDNRSLAVLYAMQRNRPTSSVCIAGKLGYDDVVVRKVLAALSADGYVEEYAIGIYVRRPEFQPIVRYTVAVEAKLRDWDRVLYQSSRHRYFANESWAVLPASHAAAAVRNVDQFQQYGLGLATYEDGVLTTISRARAQQPVSRIANAMVAEVVLSRLNDDRLPRDGRMRLGRHATR